MHTHDSSQPVTYLCHVTDTTDDRARLKINAAYANHGGRLGLRADLVDFAPATSTLNIGVIVSEQVHNTERPDRIILGVNCAPPDKKEGTKDNARNDFYYAELKDGVFVGGTLNGLELSYVKGDIKDLFRLTTTNSRKSQFRSLEILPEHLVKFVIPEERAKLLKSGELVSVPNVDDVVPSLPDISHVYEVDNFGNVKWLPSVADRALLERIENARFDFGTESIEFATPDATAAVAFNALVKPTLFAAPLGTNIVALNSSSRALGGKAVPIIATIRERPAETQPNFRLPEVGQPVILKPTRLTAA